MQTLKKMENEYYKKKRESDKLELISNLEEIKEETSFIECDYPSMGCEGKNGSVYFKTKNQAEKLLSLLIKNSSYYYAYISKWIELGEYIVKPELDYDHDGKIIYTAKIGKKDI